jgi:hypothetical protein
MSEENQSIPGVPVGLRIERIGYPRSGEMTISYYESVWGNTGGVSIGAAILAINNDYGVWNLADIPLPEGWGYAGGSAEAAYRNISVGERFISTADGIIGTCKTEAAQSFKRIVVTPLAKTLTITVTGPPDTVSRFRKMLDFWETGRGLTMEIK